MRVRISQPLISETTIRRVSRVLRSGNITQGKQVAQLERKLGEYLGTKHVAAVNSGTSALHLALIGLGIGRGDEVIVPSFSFIATANAVLYVGAKPVFADIDPEIFTLTPKTVMSALTPKTKAVIMVSLYGNPAYTAEIADLCRNQKLYLVEDAAQALGAQVDGRKIGTFGVGCFSFYATKNVTTAEGGAVVTADQRLAELLRSLRNHGAAAGEYCYERLGFNARMTDVQAALGLDQLEKLPQILRWRQQRAWKLTKLIKRRDIKFPADTAGHAWHQFTIRMDRRDRLRNRLLRYGFETKVYYPIPIHRQPLYQKLGYGRLKLPATEKAAGEVLSLPIHPRVTFKQLADMAGIINQERSKDA